MVNFMIVETNKWLNKIYRYWYFMSVHQFAFFIMIGVFIFFFIKTFISYFLSRAQSSRAYRITEEISLRRFLSYLHMPYTYYTEHNSSLLIRNFLYVPF